MSTEAPHPFTREPDTACVVDHRIARDVERWWVSRGRPAGLTDEDLARLLLRVLQLARFRALNREVVLAQGVTLALRKNPGEFEPGG